MSDPTQPLCSVAWETPVGLPAHGTAPVAAFHLALEQPGPWGVKALTQSRLHPRVGAALEAACAQAGGRTVLVREVGHHAAPLGGDHRPHQVYVSGCAADGPWLLSGRVADPAELLDWPLAMFTEEGPDAVRASVPGLTRSASAALLVCTNGKRDTCCALRGRPVAAELALRRPGDVWEVSHLGGHRFAPTALVLPTGQLLGRLTTTLGEAALTAADGGELAAASLAEGVHRGRSCLAPPEQVADAVVRRMTGELRPCALTTSTRRDTALVTVRHEDEREWEVRVWRERVLPDRPDSCGGPPAQSLVWKGEVVAGPGSAGPGHAGPGLVGGQA